jgi:integration host factor subunit alpha
MSRKSIARADLADTLFQTIGLPQLQCRRLIDDVLNEITNALINGEDVKLHNFGKFMVRHKNERIARNPKTKEPAVVSARKSIRFKASQQLKRKVTARAEYPPYCPKEHNRRFRDF